ncbi:hypothetical protein SASPL_109746 [Salvia splendens]|uniref:Photosystem II PsbX n=1 Tax=Salvia splendens TaxID=180675 RepID=A0A8X8YHQ1_SALSN|nr:uncharacterized protein LOC121793670 [Salvia splendens]KAG6431664.1 hypothetical protein SASPL_109746 [Salvia splendens]
MASTSAVSIALPLPRAATIRPPSSDAFVKGTPLRPSSRSKASAAARFEVIKASNSFKEKAAAGLTAAALTASMVVPDVAEAASGGSPSLKNFLLSIVAGGVVVFAIVGAVVGVANFDPVKRG